MADITQSESHALTDAYDGWARERAADGNHEVAAFWAGWRAGRLYERQQQSVVAPRGFRLIGCPHTTSCASADQCKEASGVGR